MLLALGCGPKHPKPDDGVATTAHGEAILIKLNHVEMSLLTASVVNQGAREVLCLVTIYSRTISDNPLSAITPQLGRGLRTASARVPWDLLEDLGF